MKKHASIYLAGLITLAAGAVAFAADPVPTAPTAPPPSATTAAPATAGSALPYGAAEVVKMYQGGIGKEILIGFVDSSTLPFHLSADNIIYLQHLGLPQEVTSAMMHRDAELQKSGMAYQQMAPPSGAMPPNMAQYQAPPAGAPGPGVATPSGPPPSVDPYPAPPVVNTPAPAYVDPGYPYYYGYPYYGYPYYGGWWGPGWGWRGGWGGGWRGGGFRGGFHR